MRAVMVSVDYADLLAITLQYNRHHFEDVCIVTTLHDIATLEVAKKHGCSVHVTDSFYAYGAAFNKWIALEEGLDKFGRHGWFCLMDADVLWPKSVQVESAFGDSTLSLRGLAGAITLRAGQLCSPLRRMWDNWPVVAGFPGTVERQGDSDCWLPDEKDWSRFAIHRNVAEWAGYSQIFHASDPVLGPPPWHEIDWRHAGGADSFFQAKWKPENKVRPLFEVLHLGPAGQNWFGRATTMMDGTVPAGATAKRNWSGRYIWEQRRRNRAAGLDQFEGERIDLPNP